MRRGSIFILGAVAAFVLFTWLPLTAVGVVREPLVHGNVTPTVDLTTVVLNRLKLQHDTDWWWIYSPTLITALVTAAVALIGGLIGFFKWSRDNNRSQENLLADRKAERDKRDDERFQVAVGKLGETEVSAKISAIVVLCSFLEKDYERFYKLSFDLAVANLRLLDVNLSSSGSSASLAQSLVVLFKESFVYTRAHLGSQFRPEALDATGVHLPKAYLRGADLNRIWMPEAYLRDADLTGVGLADAVLGGTDFARTDLSSATLMRANFVKATFTRVSLRGAYFDGAVLDDAIFVDTDLAGADFSGSSLARVKFTKPILTGVNLESARSLQGAEIRGAVGFDDPDLRRKCEVMGAVFL